MCRPEYDFEHMCIDFQCEFHDVSVMDALKSRCKALEHIRMAFWPLCYSNKTFCYIILSEQGAHRVDFCNMNENTAAILMLEAVNLQK